MKNYIIIAAIAVTSVSCKSKPEITVQLDNASGLTVHSPVSINGMTVGEVENLMIGKDNKILAAVSLEKEIPNDSRFYINQSSLLGGKELVIERGNSTIPYKGGETVIGKEKINAPDDKLIKSISGFIDKLASTPTKEDSILIELRRLNENLEKLEKTK